jgi:hypothetical protein
MNKIKQNDYKCPSTIGAARAICIKLKVNSAKRDRRVESLIEKAHEYNKICGSGVRLGIWIRETARVLPFRLMLQVFGCEDL